MAEADILEETDWIWIMATPLPSCVTLGKELNLSEPLYSGDTSNTYSRGRLESKRAQCAWCGQARARQSAAQPGQTAVLLTRGPRCVPGTR